MVLVASMVCECAAGAMASIRAAPSWNSNRKDGVAATANLDFARLSRASTYAPAGGGSIQKARSPDTIATSAIGSTSTSCFATPHGEEAPRQHHRTGLSRTLSVRDGLAEDVAQAVHDEQCCGTFAQGCASRFQDHALRPVLRASRRMDHEYRAGVAASTQTTVAVKTNLYPYMFRSPACSLEQA